MDTIGKLYVDDRDSNNSQDIRTDNMGSSLQHGEFLQHSVTLTGATRPHYEIQQHGNNMSADALHNDSVTTNNYFNVFHPNYALQSAYASYQDQHTRLYSTNYGYNIDPFESTVQPANARAQSHVLQDTRYALYPQESGQHGWQSVSQIDTLPVNFRRLRQFPSHEHVSNDVNGTGGDVGNNNWNQVNSWKTHTSRIPNDIHVQGNVMYTEYSHLSSSVSNTNMAHTSFDNMSSGTGFLYGNSNTSVFSSELSTPSVPEIIPSSTSKMPVIPAPVPTHYMSEFESFTPPTSARAAQHNEARTSLKRGKPPGMAKNGLRPQRRGPLSASTRNKVEEMRDISACWRCRKYKKPCNGPGVCDSCLIPKFKIWPSAIGCRRENLESMVLFLLPAQLEEGLGMLSGFHASPQSWRRYRPEPVKIIDDDILEEGDIWAVAKKDLLATKYFGIEFIELVNIAIRYQKSLPVPHKCLQTACQTLVATCAWYRCVVNVADAPPTATILQAGTSVRTNTRKAFTILQHTCLSTKRTDWFPAVLSALLLTIGAVYYMDVLLHLPSDVRDFIWHDLNNTRTDLRNKTYMLLVDLLRASTKGINPLMLDCWARPVIGKPDTEDKISLSFSRILLGGDQGAMAGLADLKEWQKKYGDVLEQGKQMFAADMVQQSGIPPIAGSWKVFEMG